MCHIIEAAAGSSTGSRAAEELGWDFSNFRNVKIVSALRIGTGRAFYKAGPDIEKASPIYDEQHIYLNLWSVDILSISDEQVSQPDMQIGCLLGLGKLLCIF